MGFKINVDRFGFAKKPEPEKVSRDYAAEYAKSLVEKEANIRNTRDIELHNEIIAERNARTELKTYVEDYTATETSERIRADGNLQRSIITERDQRREKDNEIEEKINNALTEAITYTNNAVGQEEELRTKSDTELLVVTDALNKRIGNTYTKDEVDGKIGSIDVDLSDYYTKQDIDLAIGRINDKIGDIDSALDEIIALQVDKGGDAQ